LERRKKDKDTSVLTTNTKDSEEQRRRTIQEYIFQLEEAQDAAAAQIKAQEEDLQQTVSLLRATLESTADGILAVDLAGRIVCHNQKFADMWQIPEEILTSREVVRALKFVLDQLKNPLAFLSKIRKLLNHPEQQSIDIIELSDGRIFERHSLPQFLGDKIVGRVWSFRDITERKRAEHALQQSEQRLKLALRAANQGWFDVNVQTGESVVSEEYATMLGFEPENFSETMALWLARLHPDDRAPTAAVYRSYLRGDLPEYRVEFRQQTRSGDWKWIMSLGSIVEWDDDGKPRRLLGTHTDITARKQAEEALRDSENRYRSLYQQFQGLLNAIPDTICLLSPDLKIVWGNEAAAAHIDQPDPSHIIGRSCYHLRHHRSEPCEECPVIRCFHSGQLESVEAFSHGNMWELRAVPLYDEHGGVLGAIEVTRNITERKQAEAALKDSERRMSDLIDFLPDATMAIDDTGKVIAWNRAIEEMTGVKAESMMGKGDYEYALPFYGRRRPILIDLALWSDAEIETKYSFLRKEGDILVAEGDVPLKGKMHLLWGKARPLYDNEGKITGAIEVIRDVTERQRAEEERAKLEAQMREVQKLESLGVLAGGIAHDFNNLLMAILGNVDLALISLSPASPVIPCLEEISRASQRAADLCRQMLAYSGRGRFIVGHHDLSAIVREMAQMLEVSVSKKATLRYDFPANLPAVEADATQLRQIIMNLITNASEALEDHCGAITLSTGVEHCNRAYLSESYLDDNLPEGQYVYLEVSDTGSGINAEAQTRIFDPFFTTKFTGRGLGLAAVLGIVRGHKGAIKVFSAPAQGTTIKILFPAVPWSQIDRGASPDPSPAPLPGGVILLVDDDPSILQVGEKMLERLGFTVLTATDGRSALEIFKTRAGEIDCVLLDLTMPRMGGEEAFSELRRLRSDVPVILSSGYNEQEVIQLVASHGLAGFLQKPYTITKLRKILSGVLGLK